MLKRKIEELHLDKFSILILTTSMIILGYVVYGMFTTELPKYEYTDGIDMVDPKTIELTY